MRIVRRLYAATGGGGVGSGVVAVGGADDATDATDDGDERAREPTADSPRPSASKTPRRTDRDLHSDDPPPVRAATDVRRPPSPVRRDAKAAAAGQRFPLRVTGGGGGFSRAAATALRTKG